VDFTPADDDKDDGLSSDIEWPISDFSTDLQINSQVEGRTGSKLFFTLEARYMLKKISLNFWISDGTVRVEKEITFYFVQ
jgi:hypothetical protein